MPQNIVSESIKGKKILLLYAKFFNYDVIVRDKLLEMGAEVDLFDARAELNVYEKALINYDLYNPNNITVIDRDKPFVNNGFLSTSFVDLDESLLNKYSLSSWIQDLFCE